MLSGGEKREHLCPKGMEMGSAKGFKIRKFIICAVHLI